MITIDLSKINASRFSLKMLPMISKESKTKLTLRPICQRIMHSKLSWKSSRSRMSLIQTKWSLRQRSPSSKSRISHVFWSFRKKSFSDWMKSLYMPP
jgi:hypothetical protein